MKGVPPRLGGLLSVFTTHLSLLQASSRPEEKREDGEGASMKMSDKTERARDAWREGEETFLSPSPLSRGRGEEKGKRIGTAK